MPQFPFPSVTSSLTLTDPNYSKLWPTGTLFPLPIKLRGDRASVGESAYRITPVGEIFCATRPERPGICVGKITQYGVREALTNSFFQELAALRALIYRTSYPAPMAYRLRDGSLVHPGECFMQHSCALIARTHYHLDHADTDELCDVCAERFL